MKRVKGPLEIIVKVKQVLKKTTLEYPYGGRGANRIRERVQQINSRQIKWITESWRTEMRNCKHSSGEVARRTNRGSRANEKITEIGWRAIVWDVKGGYPQKIETTRPDSQPSKRSPKRRDVYISRLKSNIKRIPQLMSCWSLVFSSAQ